MRAAFVLLALVACTKKHDDNSKTAAPAASNTVSAPGASNNTVSAPSGAALPYKLKPVEPGEAEDLASLKDRTKSAVREWLREEPTADGWIATYSSPRLDNVQDERGQVERKEVGLDYGVYVRRTIDGKPYKCVARLPKREDIDAVVAACKTAMPSAN